LYERVIRLIDGELRQCRLPQMFLHTGRREIDIALRDAVGEILVQPVERAMHAEQHRQSMQLGGIAVAGKRELPGHQIERVDRDTQLERGMT
jgi:tRNA A37 threonylcarbamoyltransferase TsaD